MLRPYARLFFIATGVPPCNDVVVPRHTAKTLDYYVISDPNIKGSGYSSGSRTHTCTAIRPALKLRLFFDKKREKKTRQRLDHSWKWVRWPGQSGSLGSPFWRVKWVSSTKLNYLDVTLISHVHYKTVLASGKWVNFGSDDCTEISLVWNQLIISSCF